jgi:hypothetical protein
MVESVGTSHVPRAPHEAQRGVGEERAVLDAAHPGGDGRVRALVAVRVRHHRDATRGGFLDDGAELGLGVDLLARVGVGEPGAFGAARLDPIHAPVEVHAHQGAQLRRRAHAGGERAETGVGEDGLVQVRRHEHAGGEHVRRHHVAGAGEVTHRHVLERRYAGAAHGGHAGEERAARVGERGEMRVRIDQPRHHPPAADVDHRGARGNGSAARGCSRSARRARRWSRHGWAWRSPRRSRWRA